MKNLFFLAAIVFSSHLIFAQQPDKIVLATKDPYNLYDTNDKDSTILFYYKFVPKNKPIAALVVLPGAGETLDEVLQQTTLHKLAIEKDILVILPSLNCGTVRSDEEHKFLDKAFKQVVERHQVPKDRFIVGGFSGGAMLSLTYTQKANRNSKETFLKPKVIFGVDPPLDYAHLWNHCKRDIERNFSEPAIVEGKWIMEMYKKEFGGSPEEVPENYVKYSIYSHKESDGGNAKYLKTTPIRLYTEPGISWQLENRRRDLYDLNCTDISAMINLLKLQGNKNAEMIVTHNKGKRLDGRVHPHSWSIMDSNDCFNWILKQLVN